MKRKRKHLKTSPQICMWTHMHKTSQINWGPSIRRQFFSSLLGIQCCPSLLILQATAVIRAAPFPLPSSDLWKVTWHCGAKSCSVSCMMLAKLQGTWVRKEHKKGLVLEVVNTLRCRNNVTSWVKDESRTSTIFHKDRRDTLPDEGQLYITINWIFKICSAVLCSHNYLN